MTSPARDRKRAVISIVVFWVIQRHDMNICLNLGLKPGHQTVIISNWLERWIEKYMESETEKWFFFSPPHSLTCRASVRAVCSVFVRFIGRILAFTVACVRLCCNLFALPLSHYREAAHLAWHALNLMHWLTVLIMLWFFFCVPPRVLLPFSTANPEKKILLFYHLSWWVKLLL